MPNIWAIKGLFLYNEDCGVVLPMPDMPKVNWVLTDPPYWGQVYAHLLRTPDPYAACFDAKWLEIALGFYASWLPLIPYWLDEYHPRVFITIGFDQWPCLHKVAAHMKWEPRAVWVQPEMGALLQFGAPLPRSVQLQIDDLYHATTMTPKYDPAFIDALMDLVPPQGTVGDSFAGSGSVLFAARRHGYNAVGIERDTHLCLHILDTWEPGCLSTATGVHSGPTGPRLET